MSKTPFYTWKPLVSEINELKLSIWWFNNEIFPGNIIYFLCINTPVLVHYGLFLSSFLLKNFFSYLGMCHGTSIIRWYYCTVLTVPLIKLKDVDSRYVLCFYLFTSRFTLYCLLIETVKVTSLKHIKEQRNRK